MKDLHSHLMPGIDDGSKSLEQTEDLLIGAKNNGVTDIMLTPHYVEDSKYVSNKEHNEELLKQVKELANKYNINVYLGNEVYINYNLVSLYENKEISTLNNSRYMLIETHMNTKFNDLKSVFFELMNHGITPILAHPERYTEYYMDVDFFYDLRSKGILLQMNYPSIVGIYGRKAKKMAKALLKANLYSFVGSDAHRASEGKYEVVDKAVKKITKYVGYDKMMDLTENNFIKVVNNEEI